jgi:hypothetical protein
LEVDIAGSTGTVGSAEFGASPPPSVMNGVPLGVTCGDGFLGNDFVVPGVLKGAGAVEEVRGGGDDVVVVVVVVVVVGVPGGRGGCGCESWRWEIDWTLL